MHKNPCSNNQIVDFLQFSYVIKEKREWNLNGNLFHQPIIIIYISLCISSVEHLNN